MKVNLIYSNLLEFDKVKTHKFPKEFLHEDAYTSRSINDFCYELKCINNCGIYIYSNINPHGEISKSTIDFFFLLDLNNIKILQSYSCDELIIKNVIL